MSGSDFIDEVMLDFKQGIQASSRHWYNNIQWLGRGGSAVTWLMLAGSGPFKGTPFAVKIFRRVSKPERRQSFINEMKFLGECEHPGIMRTFDDGVYREDHPFVVAEYLPRTLAQTIRARTTSMVEKLSFMLQLLSTLEYLSTLEPAVIHRDIKPQNVFVKGGACVLGDFGLLKRGDEIDEDSPEDIFKRSAGPGMPFFYRTPDQVSYARNEAELTVASDVFQLGLVAAEMFTGRNPEKRAEHNGFLSDVELNQLGFVPGSSGGMIAAIIRSMLETDTANRPDAGSLLEQWKGVFFSVASQQNAIEGRVL
ncbi:MAG: protein kinase [Rhodopirellula sp.]|nr:protein kinase [Rhodopirellula sp.]